MPTDDRDASYPTVVPVDCLEAARAALAGLGVGSIAYSRALVPTARAIAAERERCIARVKHWFGGDDIFHQGYECVREIESGR
jgi:hypothetical protein